MLTECPSFRGNPKWDAKDFDYGITFEVMRSADGGLTYEEVGLVPYYQEGHFSFDDWSLPYTVNYCYMIHDTEEGPGPGHDWGPARTDPRPGDLPSPPPPLVPPVIQVVDIMDDEVHVKMIGGSSVADYALFNHVEAGWSYPQELCHADTYLRGGTIHTGSEVSLRGYWYNDNGPGPYGNVVHAVPLPRPSGVQILAFGNTCRIDWNTVSGAAAYVVRHWLVGSESVTEDVVTGVSSFVVRDLAENAEYAIDVLAQDQFGNRTRPGPVSLFTTDTEAVDVDSEGDPVRDFVMIHGSPMRGRVDIAVGVSKAQRLQVAIFDIGGRLVKALADEPVPAGVRRLRWEGVDAAGRRVGSGVYFLRRCCGSGSQIRKLVVLP